MKQIWKYEGNLYCMYEANWFIYEDIQSTPDNSNLQGKQKKVRVIEGKIL